MTSGIMTLGYDNVAPGSPASNRVSLYSLAGADLQLKNDLGVTTPLATYKIATVTLTVAGTITFSSIPQIYKHLEIMGSVSSVRAAVYDNFSVRFGTGGGAVDTGANYGYSFIQCANATIAGGSNVTATSALIGLIQGATGSAGALSRIRISFPNYTEATFKEMTTETNMTIGSTTLATTFSQSNSGCWRNTGAITSMTFWGYTAGDNLSIGSNLTLYGIY